MGRLAERAGRLEGAPREVGAQGLKAAELGARVLGSAGGQGKDEAVLGAPVARVGGGPARTGLKL